MSDVVPEDGLVGEAWGGVIAVLASGDVDAPAEDRRACRPDEVGHVWIYSMAG